VRRLLVAFLFVCALAVSNERLGAGAGPDIRINPLSLSFVEPTSNRPIFLEIDWMEDATHSHRPSDAVLDKIRQTFAEAGFSITIDVSNAIPHQDVIPIEGYPGVSPAIRDLENTYFDHRLDNRYIYSIWAHNYSLGGSQTSSSGIADEPGRVHLVTLGSFAGHVGTFSNQVGTLLHEFGHNLGQRHGGADEDMYKPNYLSVMNYMYQLNGIGPSLVAKGFANSDLGFDDFSYSHGLTMPLDENNLDENLGIGFARAIDWDCDGKLETGVAHDINSGSNRCSGGSSRSVIRDFDNWTDIVSHIPQIVGPMIETTPTAEPDITAEENAAMAAEIERLRRLGTIRSEAQLASEVNASDISIQGAAGKSFTIYNDGSAPLTVLSMTPDLPAPWITWAPQAPFTVPAGGSQNVQVYVDFAAAPAAATTRRLLVASDDPDEPLYPGGVNISVTPGSGPGAFGKSGPAEGVTGLGTSVVLAWGASAGATGYEVCVDVVDNGVCDTSFVNVGTALSYTKTALDDSTTYYWQVRARDTHGYTLANNGAWWNFRTFNVPKADLVTAAVSTPASNAAPGAEISVTDTASNQGAAAAVPTVTRYYASHDGVKSADDVLLQNGRNVPSLNVGASSTGTITAVLPKTTPTGTYYVLACADAGEVVKEALESNNCGASAGSFMVTFPDLSPTSVTAPPGTASPGSKITVGDAVKNIGAAAAPASVNRYYLSVNLTKDSGDIQLSGTRSLDILPAGATSTGTRLSTIPLTTPIGTYHVLVCADGANKVVELNESNNCLATTATLAVGWPDLTTASLGEPPAEALRGTKFTVSDTVANSGTAPSQDSSTRYYLSLDAVKGTSDLLLTGARKVASIAPGGTASGSRSVTVPSGTPAGTYYLIACADDLAKTAESNESNNCRASTTRVIVR
jgi:subtilase family serine protease